MSYAEHTSSGMGSVSAAIRRAGARGFCRCVQCGYSICDGEEAALISATGDTIHRACWEEYAGDNAEEFLQELAL